MSLVLTRHVYFPLIDALKGTPVVRRLRELETSQWLAAEKIRTLAAENLARTLEAARRDVPYYRERLGAMDRVTPENAFDALARFPVLTRSQLAAAASRLRSRGRIGREFRARTDGARGEAIDIVMTPDFLARVEAAQWRGREWWGMRRGDPMVTLWGRGKDDRMLAGRIARRERRRNWLRIPAYELGRRGLARWVREIERFRPEFIYGYGSAVYALALHYSEEDIPPPPALRAVFFTDGGLLGFQRRLVEKALRAPAARELGEGETGAFAFECREGGVHVAAESFHVEILRDGRPVGDGEDGEVTVTVLHNRAMPIIRYNLGDWGRTVPGLCPCGRALPRIEMPVAKPGDFLRTSRGRVAGGHLFDSILIEMIDRGLRGIRDFIAIQKELDRFVVRLVPGPDLNPDCLAVFERRMRERLGDQIAVQFQVVPEIHRPPGGKMRSFRSEVGRSDSEDAAVEARAALARRAAVRAAR